MLFCRYVLPDLQSGSLAIFRQIANLPVLKNLPVQVTAM